MNDEFSEEKIRLKVDSILSGTKYSITGTDLQNDQVVLNHVVSSWFEPVSNPQDLEKKFQAFYCMDSLIHQSLLFDYVQGVMKQSHPTTIPGIIAYHKLIKNPEYQQLIPQCGYHVSHEFGIPEHYFDGTLIKKVQFYYAFRDKITSIYNHLMGKGGVSR